MTPDEHDPGDIRIWHEGDGGTSEPWFNSLQLVKSYLFHGILLKILENKFGKRFRQMSGFGSMRPKTYDFTAENVDKMFQ